MQNIKVLRHRIKVAPNLQRLLLHPFHDDSGGAAAVGGISMRLLSLGSLIKARHTLVTKCTRRIKSPMPVNAGPELFVSRGD